MRIERTEDTELVSWTRKWLGEHNEQFVAWDHAAVFFVAYDDAGDVTGSLSASICWGKLRVDNLVVRADCRGRGIGTALMERAETAARDAGCSGVYLDTMSFQALGFYERLGYSEYGTLDGFAADATRHYLHKAIDAA